MSKKTAETKAEKQAEKKQPTKLKDEQLDEVQGGTSALRGAASSRSRGPSDPTTIIFTDNLGGTE